ncbi:PfkB family carbohydrate kinase, partial [Georgenia sp. 10Sc9-8]|nr:PfkB family carbohydrate kinase [Georgenia halotolerans]
GAGVDVAGLRTLEAPTGNAIVLRAPDGESSIVVSPGANGQLSPEVADELAEHWSTATVLLLQLEVPLETVRHVATRARAGGARVVLNAAPGAALPPDLLSLCDPLVVDEPEAAFLLSHSAGTSSSLTVSEAGAGAAGTAGVVDPDVIARDLLELGPRSVVLTRGSQGAVLAERAADGSLRSPVEVSAAPADVVDTTGAGDAFIGAMAAELAAGADLAAAVRRGTEVAAVAVGRPGAQASYPTAGEVPAR